jgi:hypothetical protein
MSFFDKVTKAVSETVDRGKKEVDQFMRIQKVKGEIGKEEEGIRAATARAQQAKLEIGDQVIARLKAGTLDDANLRAEADRVAAIDAEIAGHQSVIAEKRAEIARIEAEGVAPTAAAPLAPAVPAASAAPAGPPPLPGTVLAAPPAAMPPPLPPPGSAPSPVTTTCSQCGAVIVASAAFCTECGAKLS